MKPLQRLVLSTLVVWATTLGLNAACRAYTDIDKDTAKPDKNLIAQLPEGPHIQPLLGLGYLEYGEPGMRLRGTALTLKLATQRKWWRHAADILEGEWLLARADYSSTDTGALAAVPAVGWRVSGKWALPSMTGQTLHIGPQYEGLWNDLRGITDTGHRGYTRLSSKLWLSTQVSLPQGSELEFGLLMRGWQVSHLSQADSRLRDVTNVQNNGWTMRYQYNRLGKAPAVLPWIRFTSVARSNFVGSQRWYEPANRRLELGLFAIF